MNTEQILKKLISFKSISEQENMTLLNYVSNYLGKFNISAEIINRHQNRANLYCRIGPNTTGGLMLSGHTDVVPVANQKWKTNPFELHKQGKKYFGRGTADMKSFVAIVLSLVPKIISMNLKKPVHIMLSYDEEIGCVGIQKAVPFLKSMKKKPSYCIVGEPTEMQVITEHKGKKNFIVTFNGIESHSSQIDKGVNAIKYANKFLTYLSSIEKKLKKKSFQNKNYNPPYSSINVGLIHGGIALNIIPSSCKLEFEIRDLPSNNISEIIREIKEYLFLNLEREMKKENNKCSIKFSITNNFPPLKTLINNKIVNLALKNLNTNITGTVSFGTEAGVFNKIPIETIVCGPGNIDQAHKPNEFISIEQINKCEAFLKNIIKTIC